MAVVEQAKRALGVPPMQAPLAADTQRATAPVLDYGDQALTGEFRRAPAAAADVLVVNRVGFFGGVERVILTAAAGAATHGWKTTLACPAGELADKAQSRRIPVRKIEACSLSRSQVGRSPGAWAHTAGQMRRWSYAILEAASATQACILHVHHPAVALQARRTARLRNVPLIWHVHETAPIPLAYRALGTMAARSCDMILCVSEASRAMVLELGAPEKRARLVYNAVEPRFFEPVQPDPATHEGGPSVGVFGVLEPRKGHADLIRACAALTDQWPTLKLWIVGGLSFERHEAYCAQLKKLAGELGIGDRVHFTGRRDDIPEQMARMDVVVSSSICSESLPTVLIEACALGVPVLGTDVGGAREIIRHGETGLLAPPHAPYALATHLDVLLSAAGRRMAERARLDAHKRFSPARFAAELDECYQQMAWRRGERRP